MSAENVPESPEFRIHVQNLLHNYAITHLTTNYLTLTEDFVCEFIAYLKPITLRDSYSLVLEVDPFQTFSDLHRLSLIKPYDEVPQTTNEALTYLKKVISSVAGKCHSEKVAWNDCYDNVPPPEPLIPALTRGACKATPKLGKKGTKKRSAKDLKSLLKDHKISAVIVDPINDEVLVPEKILNIKHQIQPAEAPAVRSLLKTTADMLRAQKSHKNRYLDSKYLCEIPIVELTCHEEPFMPLFPKSRIPRSGMSNPNGILPEFHGFSSIPAVITEKIPVDELDGDLSRQNLIVVDGWETIRSSPPSTPMSRDSDEEDQIDQLLIRSSPNTEPLAEEIINSNLEPVLIPRSRHIGGNSGIMPHILDQKTLHTFLEPLLRPINLTKEATEQEISTEEPSLSPIPSSLLGQPPTKLNSIQGDKAVSQFNLQGLDLDAELKSLYRSHNMDNFIIGEALDNQHDMFMEVPTLEPPNTHPPNDMHIPNALCEFLLPSTTDSKSKEGLGKKPSQTLHKFLKKVRGRESLALALSWVAFTIDKKLPPTAELLGVANLFDEKQMTGEVNQVKLGKLLNLMDLTDEDNSKKRWSNFDATVYCPSDVSDRFQILLTRQERHRLAKIEGRLYDNTEPEDVSGASDAPSGPPEHRKLEDADPVVAHTSVFDHDTERPSKRPRLEKATSEECMSYADRLLSPLGTDYSPILVPISPALSASGDKENWPPFISSSSEIMDERHTSFYHDLPYENDVSLPCRPDESNTQLDDQGSFEPLSFGPLQPASRSPFYDQNQEYFNDYAHDDITMDVEHHLNAPVQSSVTLTDHSIQRSASPSTLSQRLELACEPEIALHSLGISTFALLRAKKISEPKLIPAAEPLVIAPMVDISQEPLKPPEEIFDKNTIRLAGSFTPAVSKHRYLASVELIQKHALVQALRSDECAVELVERQSLDGADLILDPHSAIIFFSMFTLPARCDAYVERVSQQSWKYSEIRVIFEAYPEQQSKRTWRNNSASAAPELYAYTPPIVKALKKLRRDLTIADACGTKCPDTKVQYAFADSVRAAAQFARMYGSLAESRDETGGAIWGERAWMTSEFPEEEEAQLASFHGLNRFSAAIILCQISLQDFVDISPQARIDGFAGYVGLGPMRSFNADLNARFEALNGSSAMSTSDMDEA